MGKQWGYWPLLANFKLLPSDSANCIWWILEQELLGWKTLLSHSQSSIHTANGSRLPIAYCPEVVPSSWCPSRATCHVAGAQRFPAASRASLQLSYFCAKCPLLIEKVLVNGYDCKAIENWGSREKLPSVPGTLNFEQC